MIKPKFQKPRIRVKPGEKFGVVVGVETHRDAQVWQCGCGSYDFRLMQDGRIACQECSRFFRGAWYA